MPSRRARSAAESVGVWSESWPGGSSESSSASLGGSMTPSGEDDPQDPKPDPELTRPAELIEEPSPRPWPPVGFWLATAAPSAHQPFSALRPHAYEHKGAVLNG